MSYTQKMRSAVMSALLGLLALLLWKSAQRIREGFDFLDADKRMKDLFAEAESKGRPVSYDDKKNLVSAWLGQQEGRFEELMKQVRAQYIGEAPKEEASASGGSASGGGGGGDALKESVDDARARIAAIEGKLAKADAKGQIAADVAEKLKAL